MPKVSRSRRRNSRSKRSRSRSNRRSKSNRRSRRVSSRNTLRRRRRSLKGGSGAGAPQNRDLARQRAERARRYAKEDEDAAKQASAVPELTGDQQWCMGNLPLCEKIKGSVYEELKKLDKI